MSRDQSRRVEIKCGDDSIVVERTKDGSIIIHGIDIEAERSLAELGFEPHPCLKSMDDRLVHASRGGYFDVVEMLVAAGADVNSNASHAIQLASANGHSDIVDLLIAAGSDMHTDNDLAFRWAAEYGNLDIVERLLQEGADVHAYNDYAINESSNRGYSDVVDFLQDWIKKHG